MTRVSGIKSGPFAALTSKRYVIGHRSGTRVHDGATSRELERLLSDKNGIEVLRRSSGGRTVVNMTGSKRLDLIESIPSLMIEEDQELRLVANLGWSDCFTGHGEFSLPIEITDSTTGRPVSDVRVYGVGRHATYETTTDDRGAARLQTLERSLRRVVACPRDSYWSRITCDVPVEESASLTLKLKPLLLMGAYDWGHRFMDLVPPRPTSRPEVKIAVIDSGVAEHEALTLAGGYNAIPGRSAEGWNTDELGHGTHTAGVIAARNDGSGIVAGASNLKVYSVKVVPGGHLSDLIDAIEWCTRERMDVVSMSVSIAERSSLLDRALRKANRRGTTIVAPAGNAATHVVHPANAESTIAVAAFGRVGTFPEDSSHFLRESNFRNRQRNVFAAGFSNFGPEVEVCAPGVAILSTVPTGLAAADGTAAASAFVAAFAGRLLQACPFLHSRSASQPALVRHILEHAAFDLGMPATVQGRGVPRLSRAVKLARKFLQPYC